MSALTNTLNAFARCALGLEIAQAVGEIGIGRKVSFNQTPQALNQQSRPSWTLPAMIYVANESWKARSCPQNCYHKLLPLTWFVFPLISGLEEAYFRSAHTTCDAAVLERNYEIIGCTSQVIRLACMVYALFAIANLAVVGQPLTLIAAVVSYGCGIWFSPDGASKLDSKAGEVLQDLTIILRCLSFPNPFGINYCCHILGWKFAIDAKWRVRPIGGLIVYLSHLAKALQSTSPTTAHV